MDKWIYIIFQWNGLYWAGIKLGDNFSLFLIWSKHWIWKRLTGLTRDFSKCCAATPSNRLRLWDSSLQMCSMERGPQARYLIPPKERRQPDSEMVAVEEVRSVSVPVQFFHGNWSQHRTAVRPSLPPKPVESVLQGLTNDVTAYAMLRWKVTDVQSRFFDVPVENLMFMFELLRIVTGKESGLGFANSTISVTIGLPYCSAWLDAASFLCK